MPVSHRKAREVVLLSMYEMDVGGHDPSMSLDRLVKERRLGADNERFAYSLLQGLLGQRAQIDAVIQRAAPERPLHELAAVDRNILRIAIREFLVDNLTPVGAAVNEAVELAKKYGSDSSARFINGVLGAVSTPDWAVVQEGK